jgi:hypothetical protein
MPDPIVTPPVPKSKEEWDALYTADPAKWKDLTQTRMDQVTRENRETKEQLARTKQEKDNLEVQLRTPRPPAPPAEPPPGEPKPFSPANLPKSKEEWDQLYLEDPVLATDLRFIQNQQVQTQVTTQTKEQEDFEKEHKANRGAVQQRHPDMYVAEKNDDGTPKVDAQGQPVLKINPATGEPIFDAESEKGRLWIEIYNEDPRGFAASKKGPRLMMLEMDRRLKEKADAKIAAGQPPAGTPPPGQGTTPPPDQRGTLPGGVPPPVKGKVTFASDDEKAHAERAVTRGVYKNLEEYCQLRDTGNAGFVEEGRTPKFG